MTRMNWNRPRGGYEPEPWQRDRAPVALPRLDPTPVREHRGQGHKILLIETRSGPHRGFYRCQTCDKWLAWAPKNK